MNHAKSWRPIVHLITTSLGMLGIAMAGFIAWIIALGSRLASTPIGWWRWRDDAVITLSHAQNLVQFGTIGVSPGDRVEGFSSPLQFLFSSAYFWLTEGSYGSFLDLQVFACIGLSGGFVALTIHQILDGYSRHSKVFKILASIGLTFLAGACIAASWTTTGWLASGMENPLATVIGLAIIYLCALRPRWSLILVTGMLIGTLGLVRVEFPAFSLPLCAGIFLYYSNRFPSNKGKIFAYVIVLPLTIWAFITVGRILYFGDALPNTALVQGKSNLAGLKIILLVFLFALYACFSRVVMQAKASGKTLVYFWKLSAIACTISALILALVLGIFRSESISNPYWMCLLSMIAFLSTVQCLNGRNSTTDWTIDLVFMGLLFIPIAQFIVMGKARMESVRILSLATPWIAVWIASSVANFASGHTRKELSLSTRLEKYFALVPSVVLFIGAGIADKPRDMPWLISPSEDKILSAANSLKERHLPESTLVLVANPDLGKISFPKKAVITDLGWLGDPLLARISKKSVELESVYLNEVSKPDIVEAHGYWACRYSDWLLSRTFKADYILTDPAMAASGEAMDDKCPLGGRYAIWERKNTREALAEYNLTKRIMNDDDPIIAINQAMKKCLISSSSPFRCSLVARSIQRSYLRLKRDGLFIHSVEALTESPSYFMDSEILVRSPGWGQRAYEYFIKLAGESAPRDRTST
jgi:hypothetical protein